MEMSCWSLGFKIPSLSNMLPSFLIQSNMIPDFVHELRERPDICRNSFFYLLRPTVSVGSSLYAWRVSILLCLSFFISCFVILLHIPSPSQLHASPEPQKEHKPRFVPSRLHACSASILKRLRLVVLCYGFRWLPTIWPPPLPPDAGA